MQTADFKTSFTKRLRDRGVTVAQWSREHGFRPVAVSQVLNGQSKAVYGTGFQIAVALGIKPKPDSESATDCTVAPPSQQPT